MPTVTDTFGRANQAPITSPWTNVGGPSGFTLGAWLTNNGFSPPSSAQAGGGANGGANGGLQIRLGDGAYQPTQSATATIKSIAPLLATMTITAASFSTPNTTYTYSSYVGNGDAMSGVSTSPGRSRTGR